MAVFRNPNRANEELQDSLQRSEPNIVAAYGLIGAILLFGGIGYAADRWLDTSPWLLLAGLIVGIAIGFFELIKTVRHS